MKEFNALVLSHYDFINDKNRKFQGTKFLVNIAPFGVVEANGPYAPNLEVLSEVKVILTYKDNKFRVIELVK